MTLVQPCLKATVDVISLYKDTPGPQLSKVDHVIMSELKEFDIRATDAMKQDFKANVQSKHIQALLDGLSDRFPNMSELEAFSLFDPQKLEEELAKYGERKLEILHLTTGTWR